MKRLIFSLPDELFVALKRLADQEGTSVAAVLRDAAERKVAVSRPKPRSLGIGFSSERNIAERIGDEEFNPDSWR